MLQRQLVLPAKQSFFLFGPRQTGKSTLLRNTFKKDVWYVNLLDTDDFLKYVRKPSLFRLEAITKIENEKIKTIIIDEAQKIPALLDEVQLLMDKYKCQFIMSGSSARKLKRGSANLLGGRAVQCLIFPISYYEANKIFDLEKVLQFGFLPAILDKSKEETIELLKAYTQIYLKEEIMQEGIARNIGGFALFLELAASQNGEIVSFSSIARECHLPVRTVQSYYQILIDTLIGYNLQPWHKSIRKRLVAHPKFYFFDTGVVNSINHRLSAAIDPATRGRLFEQFIILETIKSIAYANSEARVFYWRTNHGAEVDLLIEKHQQLVAAFEIKSSSNVDSSSISGLKSFQEEYPNVPLHVISQVKNSYDLQGIHVLPWEIYLEKLLTFL